ncbi:unnamed protein product [Effrenium voratum]|nr:unnamed protein product [Effrenium voratum]
MSMTMVSKAPVLREHRVEVFDPRYFQRTRYKTLRTGSLRALFLLQTVRALKRRLRKEGSDLLVKVGKPEEIFPRLLSPSAMLLTQQEVTSAELTIDSRVRLALGDQTWKYCWGSTLFHKDDIGFADGFDGMPEYFARFLHKLQKVWPDSTEEWEDYGNIQNVDSDIGRVARLVRPTLPALAAGALPLPEQVGFECEPCWEDLPFSEEVTEPVADEEFQGGEQQGLKRLRDYLRTDFLCSELDTERQLIFGDYLASKLGAWMSLGALSPRQVFWEVCRFLAESDASDALDASSFPQAQRLVTELTWRDFFRFLAGKHGTAIFRRGGLKNKRKQWMQDERIFHLWSNGRTGYPLVDACMRELSITGYMSNHARLNAASFLALSMSFDWRRGADWFESHLIDYDVTSNWGNWVRCAGLTDSGLSSFNVVRQSQKFDPLGTYLRRWVPELQDVPSDLIHEPWLMTSEELELHGAASYPPPCIDPSFFEGKFGPRHGWALIPQELYKGEKRPRACSAMALLKDDPRTEQVQEHFTLRKLQERVWRLESENKELKVSNSILQTQYTSQTETQADILRTLHSNLEDNYATIERLEKRILELEQLMDDQKQQAKDDLDAAMALKDNDIAKLKTQKEELEGKLHEVREFQRNKENMEKELSALKTQLAEKQEEFQQKMSDFDRKKAMDMDNLRKDMVDKVKEAKEMLRAKTKDQLDSTTKRTIMENEQMFTELHFQSKETEKLMDRNQSLLEENAQLRRNLLIHKDLENELARRTHLYQRLLKKMDQKLKAEAVQESSRELNPGKSMESAMPEESFSLGGSRDVSGNHPSTNISFEDYTRLQRQMEDHQSTLQMVRHEFAQYRRDHATLAQLQDQSTRLIISALYELKQQKGYLEHKDGESLRYDPDAEWQFTNMTQKQKE